MNNKPILQHFFTYKTPKETGRVYHEAFNYREHKNFWCNNHPLEDVYQKLYTLVPAQHEAKDPRGEVIRLVTNAYSTFTTMVLEILVVGLLLHNLNEQLDKQN